jgi:hypothetical protein
MTPSFTNFNDSKRKFQQDDRTDMYLFVYNEKIYGIPLILLQADRIDLGGCGSYDLSESDHRMSSVKQWIGYSEILLDNSMGIPLIALDFTDDRMATVLNNLVVNDRWEEF